MAEERFGIKPVGVRMRCELCVAGEMLSKDGIVLTTMPPLYPHCCNQCGHKKNFRERYPTIRWVSDE